MLRRCPTILITLTLLAPVVIGASPTTKTSQAVVLIKQHLSDFRVQMICFDQDKQRPGRTVDVEVTDDEGGAHSAEGLMLASQAPALIDVLADDGFFDRAVEMGSVQLRPPSPPFYVVQVHTGGDHDLYEMRRIDGALVDLLARVREGLGHSAAAKSADRAVAAIDPAKRKWTLLAGPSSRPAPPVLLSGDNPIHPGHAFVPIDPNWKVSESFLKPGRGVFLTSFSRIDAEDDFPQFYRQLEFLRLPEQRLAKEIICYPGGGIFSEVDSFQYGVDLPRGDIYTRLFDVNGQVIYYSHVKDGRESDSVSIESGRQALHVTNGLGFLRKPTFDPNVYSMIWYYQGLVLLERTFDNNAVTSIRLNDNTEAGKAAALTIAADGSEVMFEGNFRWRKSASGEVTREALYSREQPTALSPEEPRRQLIEQYRQVRQQFNQHFIARAQAAGVSLREMGVESVVAP